MKDFLKEVLGASRETAEDLFNKLEELVDESDVAKKVKEVGLVDVADFFKTKPDTVTELRETVSWLENENDELHNTLADYKLALQLLLDGEVNKELKTTLTRLLNVTAPGLDVKVSEAPDGEFTVQIKQHR